jgi:guanylate kinase
MDIDVVGKKQFDSIYPEAVGIFILPPSIDILRQRLQRRNTDSQDVIDVRVANAVKEIEFSKREGKYEFTIVNDNLEKAKNDVVALVRSVIAGG